MSSGGHPPVPLALYERLFEHTGEATLLARPDGKILRANPAACQTLRLAEAQVIDLGLAGIVDGDALPVDLAARTESKVATGLTRFRRPDGSTFPVGFTCAVVPANGSGPFAYVTFRDIGERRRDDRGLRESEAKFRVAFRTSPDSVNLNRVADGGFVEVNDGFTRLTGWTAEEVAGKTSLGLGLWADPADRERLRIDLERYGFVENLEARFRRKDGTILTGLMSARLFKLQGEPLILSMTRDITDWRRAEAEREQFRQGMERSARMEAIGHLAGGVAHDFNNMLTVILSCVESLRTDAEGGRPAQAEDVEEIRAAADRAHDLTRQLLAFARRQVIQPVSLDLNEVVRVSEKLLRRVLGEDFTLDVHAQPGLWRARCDRGQMEQVIVNLAVNARDAMSGGGTLSLTTANVEIRDGSMRPGPYVALVVKDTGHGLSPEARAHLFEPFFTTKATGKGTGLGLATVYGIVKQSGGEIRVESEPGRGTTFEILLPRSFEESTGPVPLEADADTRGEETVLVVEDEPGVRDVTVRALREAGYEVLAARSGEEAVRLGPGTLARVQILVTDVVMPGMDGRATADALWRLHPDLPVLFVSGYTEEAIVQRGVLDAGIQFLSKPFTPGVLVARVRKLLDAPDAPPQAEPAEPPVLGRELTTGIQSIDDQHRELFAHMAALEGAARAGDLARATDVFAYLERYVTEHFATEEGFMRALGFAGLESHQVLHRRFVDEVARRKAEYLAHPSRATLLVELGRWMDEWLQAHVLDEDVRMAGFLRSVPGWRTVAVASTLS
jgi:two-component system, cell cycle sensor histidine kinase and response regulator CckA